MTAPLHMPERELVARALGLSNGKSVIVPVEPTDEMVASLASDAEAAEQRASDLEAQLLAVKAKINWYVDYANNKDNAVCEEMERANVAEQALLAERKAHEETRGEVEKAVPEKRAPVQGYAAGIPWWLHLQAYAAYCKKWGPQPAMIDLEGRNCRGGFSVGELDDFVSGWREMLEGFVVQPRDLRHVDDLTIRKVFTFEQAEKLQASRSLHPAPEGKKEETL